MLCRCHSGQVQSHFLDALSLSMSDPVALQVYLDISIAPRSFKTAGECAPFGGVQITRSSAQGSYGCMWLNDADRAIYACSSLLTAAEERTLGDKSVIPLEDGVPSGRIVLGLYGRLAPGCVSNFLALVRSGALDGTVFSRVLPGEYIQVGVNQLWLGCAVREGACILVFMPPGGLCQTGHGTEACR